LRVFALEDHDFNEAIRTLGEELASDPAYSNSTALTLNIEGAPRALQPVVRDEIFRIAGEALRNAYRHAEASRIEVQVNYDERRFELRVRDNGKGIDPKFLEDETLPGHFGLRGLRERAREIGAKFTIWSAPGSGTELEVSVPGSLAYGTSPRVRFSWLSGGFFAMRRSSKPARDGR
jgi:signal transduction histidine kinase